MQLIDQGLHEGWLRTEAGRVSAVSVTDGGRLSLTWRARDGATRACIADAFVNCTGPNADLTRSANPLFAGLLRDGIARTDQLKLGLDCDALGRIRDADDRLSPSLRVVGPLARAAVGEAVGVPEASAHARAVMADLALHFESRVHA